MKDQVVEKRKYQISPDGKTLTITTLQTGQPRPQIMVYDKL
jgi:hypothetical protein